MYLYPRVRDAVHEPQKIKGVLAATDRLWQFGIQYTASIFFAKFNPFGRCDRKKPMIRLGHYLIRDKAMVRYVEDRSCTTQFQLGELYHKGEKAFRDYEAAFKWYRVAAINGSRQAQHRLGTLYARGQGVSQNLVKAYAWCKVAAFQKSHRGKRKVEILEAKMRLDQIREGRWLAQDYYDRLVNGGNKAT